MTTDVIDQTMKLTKQQTEVLKLMAFGLTDPQIADQLFISIHTVEFHTNHIYDKLSPVIENRNKRVAAVLYYLRMYE